MKVCQLYVVLVGALVILLHSSGVACHSTPNAIDSTTPDAADSIAPIIETPNVSDITDDSTTPNAVDDTAPVIEALNVFDITNSSATISWRTDEEATSQVQYSKTPQGLDNVFDIRESGSKKLTTDHSVALKGLNASTTYYFRVRSKNANGNELVSETHTFITLRTVGCGIGNSAPRFTLKDIHGEEVKLSDFLGKVVILNFWYTACKPCLGELQYWQEAYSRWEIEEGIVLLTVHCGGTADGVSKWMASRHYDFPTLLDPGRELARKYCMAFFPTTFFIGTDGTIQSIKPGPFTSYQQVEDILNSLVGNH